jgi:hypothetical protein
VDKPKAPDPWLYGILSLYAALFLTYAEIQAFAFDESYHLLAAQLIDAGKRPYIDFCFPQTPLNAYWNAAWMRLLGQNWRVPHAFAALFTIGAVILMADFVLRHFPIPAWRLAGAISVALMTGLNAMVFEYAPLAQAYGICLFLIVAAFRVTLGAVDRTGPLRAALSGLLVGAAAASSLLSAAAAPVLLVWLLVYNRAGSRWSKSAAFCAAMLVPFAPVFWLFSLGPRQTVFNLITYHLLYRKLYWPNTTQHDLEVLTHWIDSGQGLVLGILAVSGLIYLIRRSAWQREAKAQFYLCAWLGAALSAEAARAHPTFGQYFVLGVPFLAMLAAVGMYAIASRVFERDRPLWTMAMVTGLTALGLAKATYYEVKDTKDWSMYERLARKIEQVTPRDALLFADEPMYFLTRRTPPPGYELSYTHEIKLPPPDAALFHILNKSEVKRQVQAGMFATTSNCDDDEIEEYGLKKLYKQHAEIDDCSVFWDLKK